MQELDYAEMLEIPVSTVTVTKKKSLFRKRTQEKPHDDLKDRVVDSVNERVGAFVAAEDLSDPPVRTVGAKRDRGSMVLIGEMAAVCVIALAIFLTNVFMPHSAINTFIASLSKPAPESEPSFNQLTLSPVVSDLSDADVQLDENGVITFQAKCSVYPVCEGKVSSIIENDGLYTVEIAHTSTFSSIINGLTNVYAAEGEKVAPNVPFAYTDGSASVNVSLFDNGTLLNCYTLSEKEAPVWNS